MTYDTEKNGPFWVTVMDTVVAVSSGDPFLINGCVTGSIQKKIGHYGRGEDDDDGDPEHILSIEVGEEWENQQDFHERLIKKALEIEDGLLSS